MTIPAKAILLLCLGYVLNCSAQNKLALVVGIAGYPGFPAGEQIRFADRDAEAFTAFIQTPQGGSFPPNNVHLLVNGKARRGDLYKEFNWLYQAAGPNDVVYVFFAGHGIEYQNTLYFLPFGASKASPDDLGIPMAEFFRKTTRNLLAKQVVVFVDACHAAGAVEGAREPLSLNIQKEWESLNEKQGQFSMALFSSLAYQKSWEDENLGGGHGLFTWYLLEGLRGQAQRNKFGLITGDSLWNYVKDKVEDRSRAKFPTLQTPLASAGFRTDFIFAHASLPSPESNAVTSLKQKCMAGSATACSSLSSEVRASCGFDAACMGRSACWADKSRAIVLVKYNCEKQSQASCELQTKNAATMLARDCDEY